MGESVIKVEDVSKLYRLGVISTGTLRSDIGLWIAKKRGKEEEYYKIGEKENNDLIWALKNVSFDVKQGEVLGIVGNNGAGKSTLLKILSRVTEPTNGEIKVKGRIASLLEVGTGFHPELTGRENIFLNGAILGMSKKEIKSKFDEIVEFSGVEKYIDTPVKRYSSGMYVRLAFAVAAHLEPEILIVDEVLAVGDTDFQKKCMGKMNDVSKEGRTILFVSHSMPAVKSLCTRAVLLRDGKVSMEGNVGEVIDNYLGSGIKLSETGLIPDKVSTWSTGQAKFKSLLLKNSSGQSVSTLYYNQPFKVELIIETQSDLSEIIIDFSLGSFESRNTYTSSFDVEKKFISLKRGVHQISVDINPNLLPGNYCFYLGMHDMANSGTSMDYIERIGTVEVLPITNNAENRFPLNVSPGQVRIDGMLKFNQIN
jgi:lipopolysaccharide transport system ATP-binding protein